MEAGQRIKSEFRYCRTLILTDLFSVGECQICSGIPLNKNNWINIICCIRHSINVIILRIIYKEHYV